MSLKSQSAVAMVAAIFCSTVAFASPQETPRFDPLPIMLRDVSELQALVGGGPPPEGGVADCEQSIRTWSSANFGGGSFIVQAGFSEGEIAAASYTVPGDQFPVRIDLAEMIFATSNTTVTTTTKWSILFWEGTPDTGTLVATFSSDGKIIPHLVIPPGTNGTNVQFMVDPGDPEQLILQNNGSGIISVGYRIDDHHNLSGPCNSIPTGSNAFPTVDTNLVSSASNNWLYAISCPFACPSGFKSFNNIISLCKPSGDWNIRLTYTGLGCAPPVPGACCLPNGSCTIDTPNGCAAQGGSFLAPNTTCVDANCLPTGNVPCCFESTGGCLNLSFANCQLAGGVPGPVGLNCAGYVCFATGACCKPDGTCEVMSQTDCALLSGLYQGNNTSCAQVSCPQPTGASCFPNGFCIELTEANAILAGAEWKGAGTSCQDLDESGTADLCKASIPGDVNGDGVVDGADLAIVLGNWGNGPGSQGDANGDGTVDGADLAMVLGNWS